MYSIEVNNQIFNFTVTKKAVKKLKLKITSKDSFEVTAPRLTPTFFINSFIKNNLDWIASSASSFHSYPELHTLKTVEILGITQPIQPLKKLKEIARELISDELEKLCLQFGFSYNKLALKNTSTRYGSCSSKNNLNFNWQCIFFPPEIFRHLLLHELVHTKIKNHGPNFWAKLTECDPNTKSNNVWLKKNGVKHYILKP